MPVKFDSLTGGPCFAGPHGQTAGSVWKSLSGVLGLGFVLWISDGARAVSAVSVAEVDGRIYAVQVKAGVAGVGGVGPWVATKQAVVIWLPPQRRLRDEGAMESARAMSRSKWGFSACLCPCIRPHASCFCTAVPLTYWQAVDAEGFEGLHAGTLPCTFISRLEELGWQKVYKFNMIPTCHEGEGGRVQDAECWKHRAESSVEEKEVERPLIADGHVEAM
ncbi:unnamed protein product [Symbiodinium natans]|uniref:Uncharacterized protein n=1 Tax=Symbiodinium natans TaxID=878477 RepID=A0A812KJ92_9DINO|nr:unnamed protein product [Symbiodinium natans]